MTKRIIYGSAAVLAAVAASIAGLAFYDLKKMDIESLILCSANEGGILIPESACEYYMYNHRIFQNDIDQLSRGAGLDYILNLESPEKYEMASAFIARGLDINGVNHYSEKGFTALHAAVLYNDAERAAFLLGQGADASIESSGYGMTALELAKSSTTKA